MLKKVCILAVACVFVLGAASFAERAEQRQSDEFRQMRERIEELCSMAREAEGRARSFWAEAEELERALNREAEQRERPEQIERMHAELAELQEAAERAAREGRPDEAAEFRQKAGRMAEELERAVNRGPEQRKRPEQIERMHAELAELQEAAERAEREGRPDEAAELRQEAGRIAEEIEARTMRPERPGFDEARERIEQLRLAAREAKERGEMEKSERLWAEAEDIARALERESGQRKRPEQIERMHAELVELKEAAERAEREGCPDEAAELREKAARIAEEIEAHTMRPERPGFDEARERIERLRLAAREAKDRGEMEKSERLWAEADAIERELKRESEQRKRPEQIERMHVELVELKEVAERAEREGRPDEAAELRRKAKVLAMELSRTAQARKIPDIKRRIEQLHAMAAEAKQAGQHDRAQAMLREAEELAGHLRGIDRQQREKVPEFELQHQVERLREEVMRLREDMEQLREIVRNKVRGL